MANPALRSGFTRTERATNGETMSAAGVTRSFIVLSAVFLVTAAWGWAQVDVGRMPTWFTGAIIVGFMAVIAGSLKPTWAPVIGPVYAVVQGALVGAVSKAYATVYEGIVPQAILATIVTVLVMAVLYATRTIVVTDRLRSVVKGATVAVLVFYVISFALSFFDIGIPFVFDSGILGIGFSLVVIAIAAFNLLLDFDLIERGVRGGAPAVMNWFAAFGLMVTIVWLYLEILRLLGKLQSRD